MEKHVLNELGKHMNELFGDKTVKALKAYIEANISTNPSTINYLVGIIKNIPVYGIEITDGYTSNIVMYVYDYSEDKAMSRFRETDRYNKGNEGYYFARKIRD